MIEMIRKEKRNRRLTQEEFDEAFEESWQEHYSSKEDLMRLEESLKGLVSIADMKIILKEKIEKAFRDRNFIK